MNTHPNPEVFARIVLSELARLRGEVFALRLRLYQQLQSNADWEQSMTEMEAEDTKRIREFAHQSLKQSLSACGLSPDPTDNSTPDT
jgi:hypothetical protein